MRINFAFETLASSREEVSWARLQSADGKSPVIDTHYVEELICLEHDSNHCHGHSRKHWSDAEIKFEGEVKVRGKLGLIT